MSGCVKLTLLLFRFFKKDHSGTSIIHLNTALTMKESIAND